MKVKCVVAQFIVVTVCLVGSLAGQESNPIISSDAFLKLASEAMAVRENRLLSEARFLGYLNQPGTVVLDTRSKEKYDKLHVKGAVHLNFSDFNEESLRQLIPNKSTRVLIYCNNNFKAVKHATGGKSEQRKIVSQKGMSESMSAKTVESAGSDPDASKPSYPGSLALNLPTYLTLHGYGYTNVHELKPLLDINKTKIALAGTLIEEKSPARPKISPKDLRAAMEVKRIMSPDQADKAERLMEDVLRQVRDAPDEKFSQEAVPAAEQRVNQVQSQK